MIMSDDNRFLATNHGDDVDKAWLTLKELPSLNTIYPAFDFGNSDTTDEIFDIALSPDSRLIGAADEVRCKIWIQYDIELPYKFSINLTDA